MVRLFPLIFLSLILLAYWGRVLRMAYKSRRQTGRAANIVPAEGLGRFIRVIWMPIIVIWVTDPLAVAIWRSPPFFMRPLFYTQWIAWPGLLVVGACLVFTLRCWKTMGRHWRMGIDPAERNPLIANGPFSRVRHPIYALSALMMLATVVVVPSPLMLVVASIHIGLLVWEARREERHMLAVHGEEYAEYRRQIGGFVPRF